MRLQHRRTRGTNGGPAQSGPTASSFVPGFQLGRMHGRLPAKLVPIARHTRKVCEGLEGVVDGIVANRAAYTARLLAAKHSA